MFATRPALRSCGRRGWSARPGIANVGLRRADAGWTTRMNLPSVAPSPHAGAMVDARARHRHDGTCRCLARQRVRGPRLRRPPCSRAFARLLDPGPEEGTWTATGLRATRSSRRGSPTSLARTPGARREPRFREQPARASDPRPRERVEALLANGAERARSGFAGDRASMGMCCCAWRVDVSPGETRWAPRRRDGRSFRGEP